SVTQPSANGDGDHDGLTNLREYQAHSDPSIADTDHDGLSDGDEVLRDHTNPSRADTDSDGFGDRAELKARTNPRSAASQPSLPKRACATRKKNVRDGVDPWGGCFPGPTTTGTPRGTVLTKYKGPCRVTTANLVIDRKTINCAPMEIFAKNVLIKRSKVNG